MSVISPAPFPCDFQLKKLQYTNFQSATIVSVDFSFKGCCQLAAATDALEAVLSG
jgi:hypothetical protein